jgi:hypothetical protein
MCIKCTVSFGSFLGSYARQNAGAVLIVFDVWSFRRRLSRSGPASFWGCIPSKAQSERGVNPVASRVHWDSRVSGNRLPAPHWRTGLYSGRAGIAAFTEPVSTVSAHAGDDPWQDVSGGG